MKKSEIKKSIICKGVQEFSIDKKNIKTYQPKVGDIAIFKVTEIGKHNSIQGIGGNNCYIFEDEYVMLAFGNRYATEQFEGYVPQGYKKQYHILGKGGAVGVLESMHLKFEKIGPTCLKLAGYATDEYGNVLNSLKIMQPLNRGDRKSEWPFKIILSLGSAMDSGKTTTAGYICRGLKRAKLRSCYIKLTGTVYTKDRHFASDCGSSFSTDFAAVGYPSTFLCSHDELLQLNDDLLNKAAVHKPDYVVMEIADGLYQRETKMLLESKELMRNVSGIAFSAGDSLSAIHGIQMLSSYGHKPLFIGGIFTTSPLLIKEVREFTNVEIAGLSDIESEKIHDLLQIENKQEILVAK